MEKFLLGPVYATAFILVAIGATWLMNVTASFYYGFQSKDMAGNIAWGLRRGGLLFAVGIGLSGIFAGGGDSFQHHLLTSVEYSFALVAFMLMALVINDRLILSGVDNTEALKSGNIAVGVVEFGALVATGYMARGAMMGEGSWVGALVFFVLGQLALVLSIWAYHAVRGNARSLVRESENGNVAAGILLGAKLWAYGLILSAAVTGNFTGWVYDISLFAFTAIWGMALLYVAEWLIDWLIIDWETVDSIVEKKCTSTAILLSGAKLGAAFAISMLVL